MSTATSVPETYELEGDDAVRTLRSTGLGQLVKDSVTRFRAADGTSHTRSLAYQVTLALVPGLIALVGLATVLRAETFTAIVRQTTLGLAPGPAGEVINAALKQGSRAASGGGRAALLLGLLAALVSGTVAMGQIERGANRLYGVEQDRPTMRKYWKGFQLTVSAGLLAVLALLAILAGDQASKALKLSGMLTTLWSVLRWPVSLALVVVAFALLFRQAPNRRQPSASWLAAGSAVSVLLWLVFTVLLRLYLASSQQFGQTYGPLAGLIGILAWAFLTSLAIYAGLAFAAQLEAVRAGAPDPATRQDRNPAGPRTGARRSSRTPAGLS
jgi:YihY family inner membrane protein